MAFEAIRDDGAMPDKHAIVFGPRARVVAVVPKRSCAPTAMMVMALFHSSEINLGVARYGLILDCAGVEVRRDFSLITQVENI